jgi:acyl carrier protein
MREPEALRLAEGMVLSALADSGHQHPSPDSSTRLFDGGLELDSIAFLDFVLAVETKSGLRLRSEDLTGEALETVGGLARHIARLVAQHEDAEGTPQQSDVRPAN